MKKILLLLTTVAIVGCKKDSSPDVTTKPQNGNTNGHEWVDLGLSVKWATCNIGATSPEDYGDYYAWGETKTKDNFQADNCTSKNKDFKGSIAGTEFDAATVNWGDGWHLPTRAEFEELMDKCTWTWTTKNDVNGFEVTAKNGNSIFLPAGGFYVGTQLYGGGKGGSYLTAEHESGFTQKSWFMEFSSKGPYFEELYRTSGRSVRPVAIK